MILIIDNFDSFTYNLVDYFEQLGCKVLIVNNDSDPRELPLENILGVVISPGPETPKKANNLKQFIPLILGEIPLMGICLGHQAIAEHLGGQLKRAKKPMHGKVSSILVNGGVVFEGLPAEFNVVRYHSLVIEDLPKAIIPTAWTSENELMAFEALDKKAHGIQFHPEAALTQYGLEMLRNWLTFYNIV